MTLLVSEINGSSVYQAIRPDSNKFVGAIRPHLYIHNIPSGTLKVQIKTSDGELIAESNARNISAITSSPEYHGYVTFYLQASLRSGVDYLVYIVAGGGYSFSESAYVGVCNDFDLRKYEPIATIIHPIFSPLDLEVWTYSNK
jgi:hypothetical protein